MVAKLPIYVIGSSHSIVFKEEPEKIIPIDSNNFGFVSSLSGRFQIFCTAPHLAYNVSDKKHGVHLNILKIIKQIPKNNLIIFCYGWSDCMNHLPKQSVYQDRKISEVVCECADKYFNFAEEIVKDGYSVALLSVEPQSLIYYGDPNFKAIHATVGPCDMRNIIVKYFNDRLEYNCQYGQTKFINVFKYFIDENMITKQEYMIDPIHLNHKAFKVIEQEMKNIGILDPL